MIQSNIEHIRDSAVSCRIVMVARQRLQVVVAVDSTVAHTRVDISGSNDALVNKFLTCRER
jgi:hypothetical protein